jgi:hypothetical protein
MFNTISYQIDHDMLDLYKEEKHFLFMVQRPRNILNSELLPFGQNSLLNWC